MPVRAGHGDDTLEQLQRRAENRRGHVLCVYEVQSRPYLYRRGGRMS
jgi:hypothetical protein